MSAVDMKFSLEAGALIRGAIKRGLKQAAFECDIELAIDEQKGWLESTLLCRASGDDKNMQLFKGVVRRWLERINR